MKRLTLAALLFAFPSVVAGQAQTQANLDSAKKMYADFQVERARPILQRITSPSWLSPITNEQKIEAYKYLGASYAVLDRPDSAAQYFTVAIDFNPFTDLDRNVFAASEQNAFASAKLRIFKVGLQPVRLPKLIVPNTDSGAYNFRITTTHAGQVAVELIRQPDSSRREMIYEGSNNGLRDIPWKGTWRDGRLADSATYELRVRGTSTLPGMNGVTQTERIFFRIDHQFEPLNDTLPPLPDSLLLPEQFASSGPWFDLAKGAALGIVAGVLPLALDRNDLTGWQTHAFTASGVGIAAAVGSFLYRRAHRDIPENKAENARRQAERARYNAAVRQDRAAKLAATLLIISPLQGSTR